MPREGARLVTKRCRDQLNFSRRFAAMLCVGISSQPNHSPMPVFMETRDIFPPSWSHRRPFETKVRGLSDFLKSVALLCRRTRWRRGRARCSLAPRLVPGGGDVSRTIWMASSFDLQLARSAVRHRRQWSSVFFQRVFKALKNFESPAQRFRKARGARAYMNSWKYYGTVA